MLNVSTHPVLPFEVIDGDKTTKRELSNVELAEELPEMIMVRHGYSANLEAVKAQDDMLGTVLDIVG